MTEGALSPLSKVHEIVTDLVSKKEIIYLRKLTGKMSLPEKHVLPNLSTRDTVQLMYF